MPLLAITGGIASGKSTFTRLFAQQTKASAFDTDLCARKLLAEDHEVLLAVQEEFGEAVFDSHSRVDRAALRQIVFGSTAKRRALEGILHPRVRIAWTSWAREHLQTAPNALLLVEIPLLYEINAAGLFDEAIVVGCNESTQVRRLTSSRNLSAETARQIIASQLPLSEKIRLGNYLIWNDGSPAGLQSQVDLCSHYFRARPL